MPRGTASEPNRSEVLEFRWCVRPGVYRWVEAGWIPMYVPALSGSALEDWKQRSRGEGKILLTDDPSSPAQNTGVRYEVATQSPELLVEFAKLDSEEAVLAFAKAHGPLGGPAQVRIIDGKTGKPSSQYGEPLEMWWDEIQELRFAVELWEQWQNSDEKRLRSVFKKTGGEWFFNDGRGERPLVSSLVLTKALARLAAADVFSAAEYFLTKTVNRKLWDAVAAGLVWTEDGNPFVARIIPRHQLANLWLQLALAVAGGVRVHSCLICGRWMLVRPPSRITKKFCSNACRQKFHQRKKREERLKQAARLRTRRASRNPHHSAKNDASR